MTERHEATRTVQVQETYGPLRRFGSPLLFVLSLLALNGLIISRSNGRIVPSAEERALLAFNEDREEFDDWIVRIQLPDEAFDRPRAEADSFGALADFAVDTDNSVIEAPNRDAYYVLHDEYLYTYEPPTATGGAVGISPIPSNVELSELREEQKSSRRVDGYSDSEEAGSEPPQDRPTED